MAIEIKELNVTLNVTGQNQTDKKNEVSNTASLDTNELTQTIVKEVLRVLKEQQDR